MGRPDDFEQKTVVHELPIPTSVVPRTKKPFLLEQVGGPGAPRDFSLELEEIVIGRSLQAAISVEGNGMSRQHACVRRAGAEYSFTDLNSSNGVYLNGVKTHSAVLRQGDTLQLGDVLFVFHEGA